MKSKLLNILVFVALLVSMVGVIPAGAAVPASASDPFQSDSAPLAEAPANRWIVQLEDAPLAQYAGGIKSLAPTAPALTGAARLDVNAPQARAYAAYLQAEQNKVTAAVQQAAPGAYVEHSYQVVFNGLTVHLPEADAQADAWLARLPGVKRVFRQQAYHLNMYASLPLINAAALWNEVGGQAEAGKGIKVAVIDSGIYITNTCFNPTGYTYPAGFPKFDTDKPHAVSEKVIVARAYFRDDDPPTAGDEGTWAGTNGSSHATHVAGTIACAPGTVAETAGYTATISGVAPAAYLMSYRVGYPTNSAASGSFFDPELIAAIEDAVADGADIVNNSWGEGSGSTAGDPLDLAYDAAWDAGVVVVFSAGNSGPDSYTTDHESEKNITVGATTHSGTIASGRLNVSAPQPVSSTLQNLSMATASFGPVLPAGNLYTYSITSAQVISPANFNGCNPWPAGAFTGKAVLISRGTCEYGVKVLNAEQAGATFVVVHNHAAGGDGLVNMGGGAVGGQVTIPSIFVGNTNGLAMVDWIQTYGNASEIVVNTIGFQQGNIPDRMASFSSRGPSLGNMMAPDLVAPGVQILSSGYGSASGSERHMGFGQAGGTSMAAPHVSGSAAVLKQLHPTWTPQQIKSALMSTANIHIANHDGGTAGVLDFGAGRIDLGKAYDPGLTFAPASLSFNTLKAGQSASLAVVATDVLTPTMPSMYTLSISETGDITTTGYFEIAVQPTSLSSDGLGDTATFTVTVNVAANAPAGNYEGWVWLRQASYELHIPVWVHVWPEATNKVLLLDNDLSTYDASVPESVPDYTGYYTRALEALGVGYDYWDADAHRPTLSDLQAYEAVIWYTGDNFRYGLDTQDQSTLVGYLQSGGRLLASGQELAAAIGATAIGNSVLYDYFLGADYEQDNVFSGTLPYTGTTTSIVQVAEGLAGSFAEGLKLNLGYDTANEPDWLNGAGNLAFVDEVSVYGAPPSPDTRQIPAKPFLQAATGDHQAQGYVGLSRAGAPTLEQPNQMFDGRSAYLSFGFEGINDPGGTLVLDFDPRNDLMSHLLTFLLAEPTAQLADVQATEGVTASLVAQVGFVSRAPFHTADIAGYRFDFGDGTAFAVSTQPTVTHVYTQAGAYTARVEVSDIYGHKALAQANVTVNVAGVAPTASFTASATSVDVSQVITFTNTSTGTAPLTYVWDFGDGLTSTLANPTHAYTATGSYTVTLTTTNTYGSDDADAVITVTAGPTEKNIFLPLIMKTYSG